jgi:hypothetical protein
VAAWDDSTSTTKGYIVIREAGAPGTTIVFAISGTITDNTTWLQIPVTHVSSAGTLSASDDLYFSFSRTGDAGLGSGDLLAANNLSDVADAATARSNLSAAASGANTDITSLTLADGSSSAPALANTGDTNTGIFFPAADTVGVAVGGTEVWRYGSNPTTAKNLLINGAMTVAQRGTSQSLGASAVYTCDRWRWDQSSGTNGTMEQTSTVPSGSGFANSLRFNPSNAQTPGAAEYNIVGQRIEAQNLQHLLYGNAGAKTLALQFWVRSPKTGIHTFAVFQNDKAGGRNYVGTYTVASADTWELITTTIPGDTSGQIDNDTGNGFALVWNIGSGSNYETATVNAWETSASPKYSTSGAAYVTDDAADDFYITGVQLEVGSVGTDFEHEDYGTTLAKCQRYFERISGRDNYQLAAVGYALSATQGEFVPPWLVEKRASPTISYSGNIYVRGDSGGTTYNATNVVAAFSTRDHASLTVVVASGLTIGRCYLLETGNTTSDYFQANAEL